MRDLLRDYFDGRLSRRGFFQRLVATGFTAAAARSVLEAAEAGAVEAPDSAGAFPTLAGTGADLLLEQVRAAGTKFVFTNPGSLEVGFFDALTDRPDLQVIVGLHEGLVLSMADGYHKVSRKPTFVNVHATVGTAQMAGQLYNAHRDGSALIVTAGLADNTIYSDEVGLGPSPGFTQTEINRQFTKISWEVRTAASAALSIRRAFKIASTAPGGPVYIGYSRAALTDQVKGEIWPRESFLVQARPRAAADQVQALARLLVDARRPVVVLGDEVWKSGAYVEAVQLCDLLGLAAAGGGGGGMMGYHYFPVEHPHYIGVRYAGERPYPFGSADLVIQLGTRDLGGSPERPAVDPAATFVAVGLDTNMLGRTMALDLAVVGDVKETIKDVMDAVSGLVTKDRLAKIRQERSAVIAPAVAAARAERLAEAKKTFDQSPVQPDRLGYEIDRNVEANAVLVMENLVGRRDHEWLRFGHRSDDKFGVSASGGSLGWGIGAALGAKLAAPDRQVVLSIGDGSVMYSAAGFWSLARYQAPVLIVVWNNHNYQTVRTAGYRYNKRMAATGHYHGLYLGDPDIDFVKLAESQGVPGARVANVHDLAAALKKGTEATRGGSPYLLEVEVARVGGGAESTWHQKFSVASLRQQPTGGSVKNVGVKR